MPYQSVDRLLYVTAMAFSMYNTIKRVEKPFKNLLGSSYELTYPEKGIRAIGEKVRVTCAFVFSSASQPCSQSD